jgi:nicotinate-nucleotide pyrophosphorylase (carboxylating)
MIDPQLKNIIENALNEDIGNGDITTSAIITKSTVGLGEFLVKQNGVVAGLDVLEILYNIFDPELNFKKNKNDGVKVTKGQVIANVEGNIASILTAERTALNILQRMSGIATLADEFTEKIKHTKTKILDTRKTAPGLRYIDKLAVKIAGCENHRIGLYDMFLIKDNHIIAAGSITKAVSACKKYRKANKANFKIEVETTNLEQVAEALKCKVDFIMLDNFNLTEMKKAVDLINGKCKTEASGGIDLKTVKQIAETGVDFISVGALTHSVKALDISLEIFVQK